MAIPASGTISMDTLATEFGGTVPHSISEYYRSGGLVPNSPSNTSIPTSGQISLSNFYGSANRVSIAIPIASPAYNYDVYTNRSPAYVAGSSDITVTVAAPVTVGSTSTGTYAFSIPSAFNPADTITIVNNGVIQGMGGNGGGGGPTFNGNGGAGGTGGNAINATRPVSITNNGVIAGGGGGGGGGGANGAKFVGGSGGGGAGFNGGAPNGTSAAGGSGFGGSGGGSGSGGAGGGRGAAGSNGQTTAGLGGAGGGAGRYMTGNPFVTWTVTGTRLGGVS